MPILAQSDRSKLYGKQNSWTPEEFFAEPAKPEPQSWSPEEFFAEPGTPVSPEGMHITEPINAAMRGISGIEAKLHAGRLGTIAQDERDLHTNSRVTPDILPKNGTLREQIQFSESLRKAANKEAELQRRGVTQESINRDRMDVSTDLAVANAQRQLLPISEGAREFRDAGEGEWFKALRSNPIEVPLSLISESLPEFAPTIAAGAVAPASIPLMAGANAFGAEKSGTVLEGYNEASGNPYDPTALANAATPENAQAFSDKGDVRGGIIGLGAMLGGALAGKVIQASGGSLALKPILGELLTQTGVDVGSEATAQLATDGKIDPKNLAAEGIAGFAANIPEVAMGSADSVAQRRSELEADRKVGEYIPEWKQNKSDQPQGPEWSPEIQANRKAEDYVPEWIPKTIQMGMGYDLNMPPGVLTSQPLMSAMSGALQDQKNTAIENFSNDIAKQQITGASPGVEKKQSTPSKPAQILNFPGVTPEVMPKPSLAPVKKVQRQTKEDSDQGLGEIEFGTFRTPLKTSEQANAARAEERADNKLVEQDLKRSGMDTSKMSMNGFLDPENLKGLAGAATRAGKGGAKWVTDAAASVRNETGAHMLNGLEKMGAKSDEVQAWVNQMSETAQVLKPSRFPKGIGRGLKWALHDVPFQSTDARLVSLASKASDLSAKAIGTIRGKFHSRAGSRSDGQGIHDRNTRESQSRTAKIMRSFSPWLTDRQGRTRKQADEELELIGSSLAQGLELKGRKGQAQKDLRNYFRELLTFARKAGLEVGDSGPTYFPRIISNQKILADKEKALADFEEVYKVAGEEDPRKSAEALYEAIILSENGLRIQDIGQHFTSVDLTPQAEKFTKERKLPPEADKILDKYYERNAVEVAVRYTQRVVRAAELQRAFGKNLKEINDTIEVMKKNGDHDLISEFDKLIRSQLGIMAKPLGAERMDWFHNLIQTWTPLTFLSRTALSSVFEPTVVAARTGNAGDMFSAYAKMVRYLVGMARKTENYKLRRELAEDFGLVGNALENYSNLSKLVDPDGLTETGRKITQWFHLRTGLSAMTDAQRMMAIEMGQIHLRRLVKSEGDKANDFFFDELSIKKEDRASLKAFIESLEGMSMLESHKAMTSDSPAAQKYREAISIFTHQVIMEPTKALRPEYANNPRMAFIYALSSFSHSYHENVLMRQGRLLKEGMKAGLTPAERLTLMRPALMLPLQIMMGAAVLAIREGYKGDDQDKEKTTLQKVGGAASMAGMFGRYDALVNAIGGMRYRRSPFQTAAGPMLGKVGDLATALAMPDTDSNNKERRVTKELYELFVNPAANALLATLSPATKLGLLSSAASIQAVSHPQLKKKIVDKVAGEEQTGSSVSRRVRGGSRSGSRSRSRSRSRSSR